jgi:hypothetical protein
VVGWEVPGSMGSNVAIATINKASASSAIMKTGKSPILRLPVAAAGIALRLLIDVGMEPSSLRAGVPGRRLLERAENDVRLPPIECPYPFE